MGEMPILQFGLLGKEIGCLLGDRTEGLASWLESQKSHQSSRAAMAQDAGKGSAAPGEAGRAGKPWGDDLPSPGTSHLSSNRHPAPTPSRCVISYLSLLPRKVRSESKPQPSLLGHSSARPGTCPDRVGAQQTFGELLDQREPPESPCFPPP
uniref:Uncharacterized protein n=1 Tax=Pipistrellus kuhlii TaxID=59472 RepID=A0A7J7YMU8_PIPKU|nr:hypothetical protein mPipKuh1_010145 [Pipistrellus kuhlii]